MGKSSGGIRGSVSSSASAAVQQYQSTQFDAINNELRFDRPDKFKSIIRDIDRVSTDTTSEILYRGLDSNYLKVLRSKFGDLNINNLPELKSKLIGKILRDKGYMSTTKSLKIAGDFARDKNTGVTTVMSISGKKKGVNVSKHVKNYRAKIEKEFLLKRNSRLKIVNVSISKTGKLILYTEII